MFFSAALVLLFIIKLRFPKGKNIHHRNIYKHTTVFIIVDRATSNKNHWNINFNLINISILEE